MRLRWILSVLALIAAPASAADRQFCSALDDVKAEAVRSGPQRIGIVKTEAMTFACSRSRGATVQEAFCSAAAGPVGVEFTHVYPWLIYDCLRAERLQPGVETADQYTGMSRPKALHLWAEWRDGTRIDIRFEPSGDFGPEPRFKDYWGSYELVIWRT
jgi:hypothetical protein